MGGGLVRCSGNGYKKMNMLDFLLDDTALEKA